MKLASVRFLKQDAMVYHLDKSYQHVINDKCNSLLPEIVSAMAKYIDILFQTI